MPARVRWTVPALGALVVLGLLAPFFLLPVIIPLPPANEPAPPPVSLADPSPANPLVHEVTAMRDLAPLFLPTERNATLERLPRREIGRTLLDMETSRFSLAETELRFDRDLPAVPTLDGKPVTAATPADVLARGTIVPAMQGFGRETVALAPLPARGGVVEVVAVGTGELVFSATLDAAVKPPTDKPWVPIQFLASINAAGLVGPLILAERSGAEEVDQHFRNYLAYTYRVGQRLPPGIYRITVGP
jgi:hypothetical protein